MKWWWIAFALVWALSIVLDGRRRRHASAVSRADAPPEPTSEEPLPMLLTSRQTH